MYGISTACIAQFASPSKSAPSLQRQKSPSRVPSSQCQGVCWKIGVLFTFPPTTSRVEESQMPALPPHVLHAKLRAALPAAKFQRRHDIHPAVLSIPDFGAARLYLWTITHVESADRPADEFKMQLIISGQSREERGALDVSGSTPTFLMGY